MLQVVSEESTAMANTCGVLKWAADRTNAEKFKKDTSKNLNAVVSSASGQLTPTQICYHILIGQSRLAQYHTWIPGVLLCCVPHTMDDASSAQLRKSRVQIVGSFTFPSC